MERSEETRQDEARTWYVGLSRMSERLHLIYDAFPGAINHLPGDLAPQVAAFAERQMSEAMVTERSASPRSPDALTGSESPVCVVEVTDEYVVLDLPDSVYNADRVIPQDLIEFGQTERNWFC